MVFIYAVYANWTFLRKTEASLARTDSVMMPVGCFAQKHSQTPHSFNQPSQEISM